MSDERAKTWAAMWNAIDAYVVACGGRVGLSTITPARNKEQDNVETAVLEHARALEAAHTSGQLGVPAAQPAPDVPLEAALSAAFHLEEWCPTRDVEKKVCESSGTSDALARTALRVIRERVFNRRSMGAGAFEQVIRENLAWLMKQPKTLERDHIALSQRWALEVLYGVRVTDPA